MGGGGFIGDVFDIVTSPLNPIGWLGKESIDAVFGRDFSKNFVTGGQYGAEKQQRKATAARNAANAEQAKIQAAQNRRNMIQQIRAARISRAQNLNRYAQEGGVTSSGMYGALSSTGSQLSSNLNFMQSQQTSMNAMQNYMNQYYSFTQKAQDTITKFKNYQNLASLGFNAFGAMGGMSGLTGVTEAGGGFATGTINGQYQGTTTWRS